MPLSAAILQTLRTIVSDAGFITDKDTISPYLEESRNRFRGTCDALLMPANTQQVCEILSICNDENIPVVPQGGNTGHCGGAVPEGGILLNLSRMNKIRSIDPLNASMSVEAGCILADVQQAALKEGLYFPLSLAAEGSCQIGGNIATNAGGIHVLRYGNMRDLTLGLEVALPDGRLWDGQRALRKNNTGYDLKHLFVGSEGTLGIITAATLKLFPAPADTTSAFIASDSPAHMLDAFNILRHKLGEELSAFELMPRFGLELVTRHIGGARDPFIQPYHWYGVVEVASNREHAGLKTILENELHPLFERGFIQNATVAQDIKQAQALWALRENMSAAQKLEGASIKHDVSVPISKIPEFLAETSNMLHNVLADIRLCPFGHMGDGNIHFNISQPEHMAREDFDEYWPIFNEIVHEMAEKYGGSFSAEHGIGQLKLSEMQLFRCGPELDMMRLIKQSLDPNNIMNPGKVIPQSESSTAF